jgi:pyruvoyl-dependent arginine decarboxylase (PvlArgDC)
MERPPSQYHPDSPGLSMPLYELQMIGTTVFAVTAVLAVNQHGATVAVTMGVLTSRDESTG